ncbi:hypothetical protein L9F63_010989 [Diploptera punctata]|uniref:NADP-dependent oxidoreductase domain-containing protein n=1 Tax=Diploptera punctata TaxID=6984 RepID=A0AAD8AFX7_DIPPU|nr:hypothetical protein L9F63_010989 [Diploptera punctata]
MLGSLRSFIKMVPTLKLNNNVDFPVLGLGSSQAKNGEMEKAVKEAIDIGYRHFDTAFIYGNEHEIGAAVRAKIEEGVVKREDIFITNKLWITFLRPDLVIPACRRSLQAMGLEYMDMYLVHFPISLKDGDDLWPRDENGKFIPSESDYVETWKQMEECVRLGLTKSIGISNFNTEQIERLLANATIKPVVNQVECHPYFNQSKLKAFCKQRDIVITAYAPFGRPGSKAPTMKQGVLSLLEDPVLLEMATKYNKTIAQIILRYLVQHGVVPIPKSSNPNRMKENIDIFDFQLESEDVAVLAALRSWNRLNILMDVKNYPFNIEF